MLRGFATLNIYAEDLEAAKKWYAAVLGIEPYFERHGPDGLPVYYEFRVGDYQHELGLIDGRYAPPGALAGPGGAIMHWHVDDLPATFARLVDMGATVYQPLIERGKGFITASVVDPFGNILGIMTNPHYLEILEAMSK